MKIVYLSWFFNHHFSALSDVLWEKTNKNYWFIETMDIPGEQRRLGYHDFERPYLLNLKDHREQILQVLQDADVVVTGSAPEWLVRHRLKTGKLTFRYAERPLNKGPELWKYPIRLVRWNWRNPFWKPIYLLCASGYTSSDYARFGMFRNRAYQWGYFPEAKRYENLEALLEGKGKNHILWCGRFLDWKHPDDALAVLKRLKDAGYTFQTDFIGCGELEAQLHRLAKEWELEDCVRFLGSMPPETVREYMEKAGIYLFTSDRREGWGVVLNEAMNSGCAVIAGHAIGATPYLVKDGQNGLVYESCNRDMLYEKLSRLLDNPQEQIRLGRNAYRTVTEAWCADTAADRLIDLSRRLLEGEVYPDICDYGPCRKAEKIKDSWKGNWWNLAKNCDENCLENKCSH